MNQEAKKPWLAALRSGKYRQTTESLNDENGYCCLGVLCEVAIENGLKINKETNDRSYETSYDGYVDFPPPIVWTWAGLVGNNPYIESKGNYLADLNDAGLSFDEIADLIEKEL